MGDEKRDVNAEKELGKWLLGKMERKLYLRHLVFGVGRSNHTLPALGLALMEKYDKRLQNPVVQSYLRELRKRLQAQFEVQITKTHKRTKLFTNLKTFRLCWTSGQFS